jgi:hypothetical protein
LIRSEAHGGLLLFAGSGWFGTDRKRRSSGAAPLKFRYAFEADVARGRYRALLRGLYRELTSRPAAGSSEPRPPTRKVNWQEQLNRETGNMEKIERSVFELSRLIANLARVDGALVMNKQFELIGFGAEVSGELPCPDTVWQALDPEAARRLPEPADAVGTRHRAAYRFVTAHPEGLAIVISHDGAVRFVANLLGKVVYFEQFLNW